MHANFELDPATWATLRRLLESALERSPAERDAWLEQLPDEFAALKPRLRALLAHADDGTALRKLDTLPAFETSQFAPPPGTPTPASDNRVGPYRLLRELGAGGMASVWLAERVDMLQRRPVALKLPHGAWRRAGLAERLAREREILAPLSHPNIARLFDAGVSADGQPYLALEYVEGERIDAYCHRLKLDPAGRVRLFLQVARAVAHAHAQLVVHRDLKPSNILVNGQGEVKLLDFGIAKLIDEGDAAQETELTRVAGRALTPEYASPEQIRGDPIGTAADVYALGVVLYQLLTGMLPYRVRSRRAAAMEEAILRADILRPSDAVQDRALRRTLRGDLDTIVAKALKPEPAQRYRSVDAFADDLVRWLERRPVRARPDGVGYRLQKFVARNRLAVGAAACVVVALVAGSAAALWQARVALAEQRRAEEVKRFVTSIFREADPFTGQQDKPSAVDLLKRARARIEGRFLDDPAIRIELSNVLAESFLGMQETDAADEAAGIALAEARRHFGESHPQTLRARAVKAQVHRNRAETPLMRAELETILAQLGEARGRERERVTALTEKAELELDEGRYAESEATAMAALALVDRVPGDTQIVRASLWKAVAGAREALMRYGPGLEAAERAYRHAQQAYADKPRHPHLVNTRVVYARLLASAERYPEAIALIRQSIEDVAALYGPESRSVGLYLQNLSVQQVRAGHLDAAQASIERALPILAKHFGADSAHYGAALDAAGFAALAARRGAAAIPIYDRALAIVERHYGPQAEHAYPIRLRRALARAYEGDIQRAIDEMTRVVDEYPRVGLATMSRPLHHLGVARRLSGDHAQALELQRRALAAIPVGPAAAREQFAVQAEIGLLDVELGRVSEAIPTLRAALASFDRLLAAPTPQRADIEVALGRALLATGEIDEALARLSASDAFWQSFAPSSRWAGEAAWWLSRAQTAAGDASGAQASRERAIALLSRSPFPADRRLLGDVDVAGR